MLKNGKKKIYPSCLIWSAEVKSCYWNVRPEGEEMGQWCSRRLLSSIQFICILCCSLGTHFKIEREIFVSSVVKWKFSYCSKLVIFFSIHSNLNLLLSLIEFFKFIWSTDFSYNKIIFFIHKNSQSSFNNIIRSDEIKSLTHYNTASDFYNFNNN